MNLPSYPLYQNSNRKLYFKYIFYMSLFIYFMGWLFVDHCFTISSVQCMFIYKLTLTWWYSQLLNNMGIIMCCYRMHIIYRWCHSLSMFTLTRHVTLLANSGKTSNYSVGRLTIMPWDYSLHNFSFTGETIMAFRPS